MRLSCENAPPTSTRRRAHAANFRMHSPRSAPPFLIPLWLVWAAALGSVLLGLGSYGLLNNNEGLYAEIPREMIASHDWRLWVIPHLNGLPYMEKPPLLYWLTALSFLLFGQTEWSARLVPAASSLACVALLLWFGRNVGRPQAGRLAALMFATGLGVFAMSRVLMFDMLLTALLAAGLMCAYRYLAERRRCWLLWAYVFLALAVLAKGLVALLLFGLVVVLFEASGARSLPGYLRGCGKWFEWRALGVLLIIAVPWHVAASLIEPAFAWFYFINEQVLRFLGRRQPHDYYAGAWWYYLPRMVIYLFPWSLLLPALLARKGGSRPPPASAPGLSRFLWIAWLLPLVFFSVSSAKANYYLVAVMPFAALHLALALEERGFLRDRMRALPGGLIGAGAGALCVALALRSPPAAAVTTITFLGLGPRQFVLLALAALALLAFAAALLAWRCARIGILSYLALPVLTSAVLAVAIGPLQPRISSRPLAHYLRQEQPGRQVYLYRDFEELSSLPFYLEQPLPVIDPSSADLFWGNRLRPGNPFMLSAAQFAQRLPRQRLAVVVLDRQLQAFRATDFFSRFTAQQRIGNSTVFLN